MNLRILFILALLLNAAAAMASAVPDATPEPSGHAAHHGSDDAPSAPAGDGHGVGHSTDCCSQSGCDCGCAAPQVTTLPISVPRTAWRTAIPRITYIVKSVHSNPLPAPFRPPA
jgi:hypothetical protein